MGGKPLPGANLGGRPSHKPTKDSTSMVEALASCGVPEKQIADVIGISDVTLRKYYRATLDTAVPRANAMVAQSLYKKALGSGPQSVTAAIFWLKCRAQWKDTTVLEIASDDSKRSEDEIKREIESIRAREAVATGAGVMAAALPSKPVGVVH